VSNNWQGVVADKGRILDAALCCAWYYDVVVTYSSLYTDLAAAARNVNAPSWKFAGLADE